MPFILTDDEAKTAQDAIRRALSIVALDRDLREEAEAYRVLCDALDTPRATGVPVDDGGPAFPHYVLDEASMREIAHPGMTLRDWFAQTASADQVEDLCIRGLSRAASERLAGPAPEEPRPNRPPDERVAWQLADIRWRARVNAAVRFLMADAMLAQRSKTEG